MDKSCHPSADSNSSITANNTNREHYLRHLNKLSQKISKPITKKPTFDPPQAQANPVHGQGPAQQHQPPVYNINKNDFRDVVQKLTGSPAHERISTPPPIHQPKPPSSRLQRIRPPPLPQITNRPPPLINPRPHPPNVNVFSRPPAPLSPLPPFPTVHAPADSPISAYMRDLQSIVDSNKHFSGFSVAPQSQSQSQSQPLPPPQLQQPPQQQQQQQQQGMASSQAAFQMPSSPVPFGCLNSQLASYPLLSPGLLFSPTSGQGFPQLPLSPTTVPVPSPRWKGI